MDAKQTFENMSVAKAVLVNAVPAVLSMGGTAVADILSLLLAVWLFLRTEKKIIKENSFV